MVPDLATRLVWTYAVAEAWRPFADSIPVSAFATVGFIPLRQGDEPTLAVGVYTPEPIHVPRALTVRGGFGTEALAPVEVPVVEAIDAWHLHAGLPSLPDGSASCWVRFHKGAGQFGVGLLTAGHVISEAAEADQVHLSDGRTAVFVERAPGGVDAALLEVEMLPSDASLLEVRDLIAPWIHAQIETPAGNIQTVITEVSMPAGILSSHYLPARLILSRHAGPGDSGSLVRCDEDRLVAYGIYIGAGTNPAGVPFGVAQHLGQALSIMDLQEPRR